MLLLTFLCVGPLQENFQYGQYYVLILLLLCLAYYAYYRGYHFTCGAVLAAAAALKIFPAFFLLLVAGSVTLTAASMLVFGSNVHRVYLLEVLPRALRGEMLDPYNPQWNSFGALWHHFFLAEPELSPPNFRRGKPSLGPLGVGDVPVAPSPSVFHAGRVPPVCADLHRDHGG